MTPDASQIELERYARKLRDASVRLGDASTEALEFAKEGSSRNGSSTPSVGVPPGRALPSSYHSRLMELRELCRFV